MKSRVLAAIAVAGLALMNMSAYASADDGASSEFVRNMRTCR